MAEILNLNRARKAKAKSAAIAQANANRVAFGRTKSEKATAQADTERLARDLNGAKREP